LSVSSTGFVFQQDGAPAHTAHQTQDWLTASCTDFIAKDEWPPNSPDLNPLDYHVWGAMLQAFQKFIKSQKPLAIYRIFERIVGVQNFN